MKNPQRNQTSDVCSSQLENIKLTSTKLLTLADHVVDFSMAEKIKQQIANGKYSDATDTWSSLEGYISSKSNDVVSNKKEQLLKIFFFITLS